MLIQPCLSYKLSTIVSALFIYAAGATLCACCFKLFELTPKAQVDTETFTLYLFNGATYGERQIRGLLSELCKRAVCLMCSGDAGLMSMLQQLLLARVPAHFDRVPQTTTGEHNCTICQQVISYHS
ncbi:hypothetical protein CERZMDRAFT_101573 [Cercospora zeae-maydis SCOH1-5]|uniref:Uncharacterized protein n=1 Tax=Cercospora zeae-maydis SCOH1-5 TaxID=717836 RepID=A0A6A6F1F8_9PEZI|nr:hypothetical protein CERZMDRAFT_101573 [Cercospora zeae-maydis SCOH1-5]